MTIISTLVNPPLLRINIPSNHLFLNTIKFLSSSNSILLIVFKHYANSSVLIASNDQGNGKDVKGNLINRNYLSQNCQLPSLNP
jgi:hypothetical protein